MNKSLNQTKVFKLIASLALIILLNLSVLSSFNFNLKNLFSLPADAQQQTTIYCSNGMAFCTSGLTASCADPNYTPTCFGDSNFQPIECCRSSGISLNCRPDITFICTQNSTTTSSTTSSTTTSSTSSSTSSSGTSIALCSTGTYCSNGYVPDCTSDEDFKCIGASSNVAVCVNKVTFDKRTPNCIIPSCTSSGNFCMQGLVPDCSFPERFKCIGGVGNLPCCFDETSDVCRIPNCIDPVCMLTGAFCQGGFIPDCTTSETFQCIGSMPYCVMNGSLTGDARTPNCISPSCTSGSYCSSGLIPDCTASESFTCVNNAPRCYDSMSLTSRIPSCVASSSSSSSSSGGSSSSSSSGGSSGSSSSSGGSSSSGSSSSSSSGGSSGSSSSSGGSSSSGSSSSSSSGGSSSSSSSSSSGGSSGSSSGGGSPRTINKGDGFSPISIQIISSPDLPNVNEQSLIPDSYADVAGVAYSGSSPSFEIKLAGFSSTVVSVDLKDSSGVVYKKVPFALKKESDSDDTFILTLSIPGIVSKGELRFALNTNDGSSRVGILYIVTPVKAKVFKGSTRATKPVFAPIVSRIVAVTDGETTTLNIRGKYFIGKAYFFEDKNSTKFVVSPDNSSNTIVTVFPSGLNLEVKDVSVSANGELLKIKFASPENLGGILDVVLVVSTPSGSVSKTFTLALGWGDLKR